MPSAEQLLIDPTAEGTGTQLDITDNALGYYLLTHDYPTPELNLMWATSPDTEGARLAHSQYQNRTITVAVRCLEPAGGSPEVQAQVQNLQEKVGKLQREGGTLKRVLGTGDSITFDVLTANINVPQDKRYLVRGAVTVTLTFECKPFGRGAEEDLGDNTETTLPVLIFTETGIKGDVPALGRLVVDNDVATTQLWAVWGLQSRRYDNAATAALFYEAEDLSLRAGTTSAVLAGASGGDVAASNLTPAAGDVDCALLVGTHIGSFRVFARVYAPNTNTGTVTAWVQWWPEASSGDSVHNERVTLDSALENSFQLVDLGMVTFPPPRAGDSNESAILFYASSTVNNDDLYWDCVFLVPCDEGSGEAEGSFAQVAANRDSLRIYHDGVTYGVGSSKYVRPAYDGDYLLVPPAGAEGRTTRIIVKMSRNIPGEAADSAMDDISARLYVTPRYLVVPQP